MADDDTFAGIDDTRALAQAIVDTVREPLLVLDSDLRVVAASRSFYRTFQVSRDTTRGRLLYELGAGEWDIPALRALLRQVAPTHATMEHYEVERDFAGLGRRVMLLNARKVFYEGNDHTTILLAIEDITDRRAIEREIQELLRQKDVLLEEMQHRVANSLQIIASILMLKARTVQSEETRLHLHDAHQRVMSVAAVQQHLRASGPADVIEIAPYLTKLCKSLGDSMIGDARPITLSVAAEGGAASSQAVVIGLIVTELVINALKHAFGDKVTGRVTVSYEVDGTNWRLTVADDGIGKPDFGTEQTKPGLGTSIVKALAQQLDALVEVSSSPTGTNVAIVHATFPNRDQRAA